MTINLLVPFFFEMETGSRPTSLKCKMCSVCITFTIETWVLVGGTRKSELKIKLQGEFCFLSLVWFCCSTGPVLVLKAMNVAVCANIREQIHQYPWVVLHLVHHFAGRDLPSVKSRGPGMFYCE